MLSLDIPEVTPLRVLVAILIGYITRYVVSNYKRYQYWKTQKIPEQNPWLSHYRIIQILRMKGTDMGEIQLKVSTYFISRRVSNCLSRCIISS